MYSVSSSTSSSRFNARSMLLNTTSIISDVVSMRERGKYQGLIGISRSFDPNRSSAPLPLRLPFLPDRHRHFERHRSLGARA